MTRGRAMIYRLQQGIDVSAATVAVIAHPDDETFGLGGALSLIQTATIVQLTDGAPNGDDATRDRRRSERIAAFAAAGWIHQVIECGITDQAAHASLVPLLDRVTLILASSRVVWTHPYEGGHPDHDAAAYLVQAACDRIARSGGHAPERFEFASYHFDGHRRVAGRFWPNAGSPAWLARVSGERLARKRAAIDAYVSQGNIRRRFDPTVEYYRHAPRYDFTRPPDTPACLYERKRWPITNAALRAAIARCA